MSPFTGRQAPARARSPASSRSGSASTTSTPGRCIGLTWLAIREALPLAEGDALGDLARRNPVTFDTVGRVFIAETDVTSAIRQSRIDRMVPVVARHHDVREVMRQRQRVLGHQGNVVIEGRDIGTVVAPTPR